MPTIAIRDQALPLFSSYIDELCSVTYVGCKHPTLCCCRARPWPRGTIAFGKKCRYQPSRSGTCSYIETNIHDWILCFSLFHIRLDSLPFSKPAKLVMLVLLQNLSMQMRTRILQTRQVFCCSKEFCVYMPRNFNNGSKLRTRIMYSSGLWLHLTPCYNSGMTCMS